jgi:hypothetical protein
LVPVLRAGGKLRNYILNAHSITNIAIEVPAAMRAENQRKALNQAALRYDHIAYTRVAKISDPFCGAMLGAVLSNLSGWGVADYPSDFKNRLGSSLGSALTEPKDD